MRVFRKNEGICPLTIKEQLSFIPYSQNQFILIENELYLVEDINVLL